jgi:hypothetical protein
MSRTISLNHIKRIGLVEWRNRGWWIGRNVRIWSQEHRAWWRPEGHGYTGDKEQAWVIDFPTAYDQTKHCGPEKKINYCALALPSKQRETP